MVCIVYGKTDKTVVSLRRKKKREAKAKEAGLTLINQVFGVSETEAEVTLETAANETESSTKGQYTGGAPSSYYTISVKDDSTGVEVYSALVNAETGFAYDAGCSDLMLTKLTEDQLQLAEKLSRLPWSDDSVIDIINESKPQAFVWNWAEAQLNQGVPLRIVDELGMEGDLDTTHRITMGYYAAFDDGAVYDISISWPTMQVQRVSILSQSIN